MLLSLILDLIDHINAREIIKIDYLIEKVTQTEQQKILDDSHEMLINQLNEQINEDTMPLNRQEFHKIIRRSQKNVQVYLEIQLLPFLKFEEIIEAKQQFKVKIRDITQTKLSQNYTASYQYAQGLIQKLYQSVDNPFLEGAKDPVMIHEYMKKWNHILSEYKEFGGYYLQWECFGESLAKLQLEQKEDFLVNKLLVDFSQIQLALNGGESSNSNISIGEEDDYLSYLSTQYEKQTSQNEALNLQALQVPYAMNILEKAIDKYSDVKQEQLNELQIILKQRSQAERSFATQKKCNDQLIDYQRNQNESMIALKHENANKIENLKRDLKMKHTEIMTIIQIKDTEIKNQKINIDKEEIRQFEEEKHQSSQKLELIKLSQETYNLVQEQENEKIKEISQIQVEIKKLEDEVEELKAKMENKQGNPYYQQVNDFYNDVQNYMIEYRSFSEQLEKSKEFKLGIFQFQKKLHDIEYQSTQEELNLKKQIDDQLRHSQQEQQNEIKTLNSSIEQEKTKLAQTTERKNVQEQILMNVITTIGESKEKHMLAQEKLENQQHQNMKSQRKIKQLKEDTEISIQTQSTLANKICAITIDNKTKQDDKEIMMILLQHIYNAIKGKKHNIRGLLNQLEIEQNKSKIIRILQQHRISYK
eukprot:403366842